MSEINNYTATTLYGLEKVLYDELTQIGASNIEIGNRCVYFSGDKTVLYKSNMSLRTALKILKTERVFNANNEKILYHQASKIKWDNIFNVHNTFSVSSTVNSKFFNHNKYTSLVVKDAIVDQFKKFHNNRPSVDIKSPDYNINLHITNKQCNISINSSGQSLHKRGYRLNQFKAPINEVLAAGIILLSGWDKKVNFIDPMCGSGTFLIEAAMIATNKAPNLKRKSFGFKKWKNFDISLYEKIKQNLKNEEKQYDKNIFGFDIAASSVAISRNNCQNSGLEKIIKVDGANFFKSQNHNNCFLIFNPPYGRRISHRPDYYKEIGDTLKHNYQNSTAWIISSEINELKKVGLKPSRRIKLFNGQLECRLIKFDMYPGSSSSKLPNE